MPFLSSDWLARHRRWHIVFIPTYSSLLNQTERFFGLITDRAIRRAPSVASVNSLARSLILSLSTTGTVSPSCGPLQPLPPWRSWKDLTRESVGEGTNEAFEFCGARPALVQMGPYFRLRHTPVRAAGKGGGKLANLS